jgi:hypothetical protein
VRPAPAAGRYPPAPWRQGTLIVAVEEHLTYEMACTHFDGHPARPDIVRFVSVLCERPAAAPSMPMSFPPGGPWLLKILAREGRFVFGVYRRNMKAIGNLGTLDRLFGVPLTTRNWNTMTAIARVLRHVPD